MVRLPAARYHALSGLGNQLGLLSGHALGGRHTLALILDPPDPAAAGRCGLAGPEGLAVLSGRASPASLARWVPALTTVRPPSGPGPRPRHGSGRGHFRHPAHADARPDETS